MAQEIYQRMYRHAYNSWPNSVRVQFKMFCSFVILQHNDNVHKVIFFHSFPDKKLPLLVFGVLSIVGGFLALPLPETRHRPLPETIDDVEHYEEFCRFVFVRSAIKHFFYYWRTQGLFEGYWHPCFGFLVMSSLCFKARVDSLCAFLPVCNGFLRFTSIATPADCIDSMVAESFWFTYLEIMCPQALAGVQTHDRACYSTAL